jgi:hypothetical protein
MNSRATLNCFDKGLSHIRVKLLNARAWHRPRSIPVRSAQTKPWRAHVISYRRRHGHRGSLNTSIWQRHERYEHPAYRRSKGIG